jgi:hypothetical protein
VVAVQAPAGPVGPAGLRAKWIFGPGPDLLIAFCWVPLWLIGHQLAVGHGAHDDALLRSAVAATFLLSFLHQPLTLGLVYGDAKQFRQRRAMFVWTPPVTIGLVVLAVALHLWVIVPIAALWNTIHTLQQRYGLCRIYGRKSEYGSARLDRGILYAWMAAAVLVVAARPNTTALVRRVRLDGVNAGGIRLLTDTRPWALAMLVPAGLLALGLAAAVLRQEWDQWAGRSASANPDPAKPANPAKWLYQGSSLLLIASIAVDPAAGFIAYVGGHAIEYFVVVYKTSEARYGRQRDGSTLLGRAAHRVTGRIICLALVVGAGLLVHARLHGNGFNVVLYTVGVLHFLYDGVIWKLRKPEVAADFAIAAAAPAAAAV